MSVRRTVLAASLLALAFVFVAGAAAKKPPPPPSDTGPTAPANLRLNVNGPYSITLAWDASRTSASNWWYCIQRDGLGCVRVDPPQTTFTFSKLWPGTTFNYSVVAITSTGKRSAPSNTVTYATPPDTTAPTAPTLSVTGVWPVRVSVAWTTSVDDIGSQVWYTLLVDGRPYGGDMLGSRSALVLDRSPATTYELEVTVRDFFGNTNQSNVVTVTTPAATDSTPPTTPTNLRLSPQTSSPEIWLEWDQSTDDTDPQSQILYDVYVNGVREHLAIGYSDELVYCRDTGPNRLTVQAVDTSGNASGHSNEIVFIC
jgi:Fibronectin type III domain